MIESYIERLKAIDAVDKLANLTSKLYDYVEITGAYMQYLNALLNSQQQQQQQEDQLSLLEQELDEARELYTEIFQSVKDVEQIRALLANLIDEYSKQRVIQEEL